MNGKMAFISNSACSLLVCKKEIDFCITALFLQPCYSHLLVPGIFFLLIVLDFLHNYIICEKKLFFSSS